MSSRCELITGLLLCTAASLSHASSAVVIIEGIGGTEDYRQEFSAQANDIAAASATLSPAPDVRVFNAGATRDDILEHFSELATSVTDSDQLTVYLLGHGSYDDHEYKFNIAGPDLTDADIVNALNAIDARNQILVNTSSASGAGKELWQADSRIVITATRSGTERHATRFGGRFATALNAASADIDKNDTISVQEAFNFAERSVREFFETNGNLATEHAELTGDNAERITLARLSAVQAQPTNDAELTRLRASRDAINGQIDDLRLRRDELSPAAYQEELLGVMLELAEAEEAIERRQAELDAQ